MYERDIIGQFNGIRFMPGRSVTYQNDIISGILFRQFFEKDIHMIRVAIRHDQEKVFACYWLDCAISIHVFPDMMTWYIRSDSFRTPAVFRLVDSSEPCFVLEHQPYSLLWILYTMLLYCTLNFFEASIASSFAFLGCLDRGITFRHPCLAKSM